MTIIEPKWLIIQPLNFRKRSYDAFKEEEMWLSRKKEPLEEKPEKAPGRCRHRLVIALAILLLIWMAIFVYSRNVKSAMSFGLIGTLVSGGLFLFVIKLLEKKWNVTIKHANKHAKQAEPAPLRKKKQERS